MHSYGPTGDEKEGATVIDDGFVPQNVPSRGKSVAPTPENATSPPEHPKAAGPPTGVPYMCHSSRRSGCDVPQDLRDNHNI
jgi:hypothetical protein